MEELPNEPKSILWVGLGPSAAGWGPRLSAAEGSAGGGAALSWASTALVAGVVGRGAWLVR